MSIQKIKERIALAHNSIADLTDAGTPHKQALDGIERQKTALRAEISAMEKEIAEINKKPGVTDHAVIRYLERQHGFSFEATRKAMLSPTVIAAMEIGAGSVKTAGGVLKLSGKTVVTFAPKQKKKAKPLPRPDPKPIDDIEGLPAGSRTACRRFLACLGTRL